jgi:uncharacterized protein (DUF1501 family)
MANIIDRRKFIGQASCMAVGSSTLLSTLLNLKAFNNIAQHRSIAAGCNDYKALVCLFNSGGMDSYNMLIPTTQDEYNAYSGARSNLSIAKNILLPITHNNTSGRAFGLHPSMKKIKALHDKGQLAFVSNVGTLIQPITKTDYKNETAITPLGLFSHSDQQMHWQTGFAHARDSVGWGGKMADIMTACNTGPNLPVSFSMSGTNLLQAGRNSVEFTINPEADRIGIDSDGNPASTWWYETMRRTAMTNMLDKTYANVLENTYKNTIKNTRAGMAEINAALATAPKFDGVFSDTYLSNSFKMAAKLISTQANLGMSRQVFFIDYSGWDHHDELLSKQKDMLDELDAALGEFHTALTSINKINNVTTFSISEFARTLTSNGNGTDHAWGGNTFVMGGSVVGNKMYGTYPTSLALNGNTEVGGGVFIPSTSAEQYLAEIALWFGVAPTDLPDLFPNLKNFWSISGGHPVGFLSY